MTDPSRERSPIERHIQSGLLVLVISLLGWVGSTMLGMSKSVTVLETQMGTITANFAKVDTQLAGVQRISDAQRDVTDTNRQLDDIRRRIDKIERTGSQ